MTVTARPRSSSSASDPQAASIAVAQARPPAAHFRGRVLRSTGIEHVDLHHEREAGAMDQRCIDHVGPDRFGMLSQLRIVHRLDLLLPASDIEAKLAHQEAIGDRLSHIAAARWWLVDD